MHLSNYTRFVECSYFTKQAFVRGEIVDVVFHLIPPHSCSCWRGIQGPPPVEEQPYDESEEKSDLEEPGSSSDVPNIHH